MASPFVGGVVALLLQTQPAFGPADIRNALRLGSRITGRPPVTFDAKWGYGLIDGQLL